MARVFAYLPSFFSQILDLIYRMVLIFIFIYFEWRDTENQQLFNGLFHNIFIWSINCEVSSYNRKLKKLTDNNDKINVFYSKWSHDIAQADHGLWIQKEQ